MNLTLKHFFSLQNDVKMHFYKPKQLVEACKRRHDLSADARPIGERCSYGIQLSCYIPFLRESLLPVLCRVRHLKAAQLYNRKNKTHQVNKTDSSVSGQEVLGTTNEGILSNENEDIESADNEDIDTEHDNEDDEDEDGEKLSAEYHMNESESHQRANVTDAPPISTQVTDMSKGKPVYGLQVSLYKLIDGRWTYINEGTTNSSGSFSQFLDRSDFMPGRYKLHYDVDRYFEAKKQDTMYPFIEIVFDCTMYLDTQHIPLLLSPFGYTTHKA